MRSDHSRVLAFLLVWGVGAAPGQRLRRAGEAQRDFGPISSTDLATHFGDGLGRRGQRLQVSPQQQFQQQPFQPQQQFSPQQQQFAPRQQQFPQRQQQFVQQQPQQQFPGGEPTGSIVKAELPQAPGVGSLFDSIVKKINNGHREKARRKQQSGSRGRNPAPPAAASSSDPFRAPLNRPRPQPSSDVQAPAADPFSTPVGRPQSQPLTPNPQQTSRAGPTGGAQSELARRRGGENGSRRPPAPALGLALFGRGEVAPAFENNPRAASSNFDGAAASIANETPRRQDDEAARKKTAMEKRLRELEEARVKELAEATLRDLENLRRKEEEEKRAREAEAEAERVERQRALVKARQQKRAREREEQRQ